MTDIEIVSKMGTELFVALASYAGHMEAQGKLKIEEEYDLYEKVMKAARYFLDYEKNSGELLDAWQVFDEGLGLNKTNI